MNNTSDHQSFVRQFHIKFGLTVNDAPTLSPADDALRVALIREELEELKQGIANNDRVEIADALADLEYVILGAGVTYGINVPRAEWEWSKSNAERILTMEDHVVSLDLFLDRDPEEYPIECIRDLLGYLISAVLEFAGVYSIPLNKCFEEVHRSNMSKLWTAEELDALSKVWEVTDYEGSHFYKFSNGNTAERRGDEERRWLVKRADGKVLKSPSYSSADIAGILSKHA